jgi:hypothetical protein
MEALENDSATRLDKKEAPDSADTYSSLREGKQFPMVAQQLK